MFVFRQVSYLLFALFAATLGYQALQISGSARLYPLVLAIVVLLGCAASMLTGLVNRRAPPAPTGDVALLLSARGPEIVRTLAFCALWIAYVVLLPVIGFLVATTLAIALSFWLLQLRRPVASVLGALVFSLILSVLFTTVFYIPVPQGAVDTWLTELVYQLKS